MLTYKIQYFNNWSVTHLKNNNSHLMSVKVHYKLSTRWQRCSERNKNKQCRTMCSCQNVVLQSSLFFSFKVYTLVPIHTGILRDKTMDITLNLHKQHDDEQNYPIALVDLLKSLENSSLEPKLKGLKIMWF